MFVPGKPFQPSLVFAGKAGAYLSGAPAYHIESYSAKRLYAEFHSDECYGTVILHSRVLANTRLGWKGLPGANTLAYYENL